MANNINKFLEELSKNDELREKLISLNKEFPNKEENERKLVELAKKYGFELEAGDFANSEKTELDDSELEAVSGGSLIYKNANHYRSSDCICAMFGAGTADDEQKTCFCAVGGTGELTEIGKQNVKKKTVKAVGSNSAPVAMCCVGTGSGAL